jgi:hypothetical protein
MSQNLNPQRHVEAVRWSFLRQQIQRSVGMAGTSSNCRQVLSQFLGALGAGNINSVSESYLIVMSSWDTFWDHAPIPSFIDVLWNKVAGLLQTQTLQLQMPQQLPARQLPQMPADCQVVAAGLQTQIQEICNFLRTYYKTGQSASAAPVSSLTAAQTRNLRFIILRTPAGIAGTISSQSIGRLSLPDGRTSAFHLRFITNFCVHPALRKKGAASKLLQAAWADCGETGSPALLFLKEGQPLLKAGPALYSSRWMYRQVDGATEPAPAVSPVTDPAAVAQAAAASGQQLLYNTPNSPPATCLYIYKGMRGQILAAFSDAYQVHSADGAPIYYMTGWLETGTLLPMERLTAARQLSAAAAKGGPAWVWLDQAVAPLQHPWRPDGPFHYYAFNWTVNQYGSVKLFLQL